MLIMSTGAPPPAVVRNVDEVVHVGFLVRAAHIMSGQLGVGVLETDQHAESTAIQFKARELFSGSNGVFKIIGSEGLHPWNGFLKRHVFAKWDTVHFVIA